MAEAFQQNTVKTVLLKCLPEKSNWKYIGGIIGWVFFYFIYLFIGGLCIMNIEEKNDKHVKESSRKQFLKVLAKHNISANSSAIKEVIHAAVLAYDVGGINLENLNDDVGTVWNLGVAVFFCSTIVTTIGYGNLVPITTGGKVFTIFYALIGIPITGFVLVKIGDGLIKIIKKCDNFLASYILTIVGKVIKDHRVKLYVRICQIVITITFFVIFFWIIPAAIMTSTESWDFITAVYFCFVSLTTIGLGDVVPGTSTAKGSYSRNISMANIKAISFQLSVLLYLLMGLAALTIILNLIGSIINVLTDSTLQTAGNIVSNTTSIIKKQVNIQVNKVRKTSRIEPTSSHQDSNTTDIDAPVGLETVIEDDEEYSKTDEHNDTQTKKIKDQISAYDRFMEVDLFDGGTRFPDLDLSLEGNHTGVLVDSDGDDEDEEEKEKHPATRSSSSDKETQTLTIQKNEQMSENNHEA